MKLFVLVCALVCDYVFLTLAAARKSCAGAPHYCWLAKTAGLLCYCCGLRCCTMTLSTLGSESDETFVAQNNELASSLF